MLNVAAFAFVGVLMWLSYVVSKRLTFGRIHGSAIAIVAGLVLAYVGGKISGQCQCAAPGGTCRQAHC